MSTNQVINDVEPRTQIVATSLQTVFNAAWTADVAASVLVYARATGVDADDATQLIADTEYSVSFIGSTETVRVTFSTGRVLDDIVTLVRSTDSSRTNLYTNTNFTPSMLNQDFGIETLVQQQNQMYARDFAPHYNFSATYTNDSDTDIDLVLPVLGANQVWAMNAGQTKIVGYDLSETGGLVNTVVGTANQIDVDSTDGTNPVLSLSSTLIAPGTIQSGNIKVNGNTITSEDTDGDMNLTPNGTGDLVLDSVNWPQADGTTDQVLSTDGSGQSAWVDQTGGSVGGGFQSIQTFTSSGTWTKPAGITHVIVEVVGGGGAGGGSLGGGSVASAGGGGGGGYSTKFIDVSAISSETVTIGASGTLGAAGNNPGGDGVDTTFGTHCTGGGGGGGLGSASSAYSGGRGGAGGAGSSGTVNTNGGPGGNGATRNGNANPGFGGSTYFGGGAQPILSDAIGSDAVSYGGGGGGSVSTSTSRQGGGGFAGICVVYEYTIGAVTDAVAATQAGQEAATSADTFVSPSVQQYHPSAAKAWVVFDGTGTVAISASYNVASITDNGTGDYTVNFTNAFSSANYSACATNKWDGGGTAYNIAQGNVAATASAFNVNTFTGAGAAGDSSRVSASFFGEQV